MALRITIDDLSGAPTRRLIGAHLAGMHANSPAESVHALGIEALSAADVTVWSAWLGDDLVGVAALRRLDDARGEVKSMRVDDRFRGTGAGRALLRHLIVSARAHGIRSLWLETGTTDDFLAARRLYASEGFAECAPFDAYVEDPFSTFMTREV